MGEDGELGISYVRTEGIPVRWCGWKTDFTHETSGIVDRDSGNLGHRVLGTAS